MSLWAITSYYNPKRWRSRHENFLTFRACLPTPLLTIEWALDGDFQLAQGDSDVLISVSGGDLVWQKERLLNVAVSHLPTSCQQVAWLDCDVVFQDDRWVDGAERALRAANIAQLFSRVVHLPSLPKGARQPSQLRERLGREAPLFERTSLVAARSGREPAAVGGLVRSGAMGSGSAPKGVDGEHWERARLAKRPSSGHAWAANRRLLDEVALYDGCICGAGDMAIALAALGWQSVFTENFPLNAAQRVHYEAWAARFGDATQSNVELVPGNLYHLFHGNLSSRQYASRLQLLAESSFDPATDLVSSEQGPWALATARGAFRSAMNRYFERRAEDDDDRHPAAAQAGRA